MDVQLPSIPALQDESDRLALQLDLQLTKNYIRVPEPDKLLISSYHVIGLSKPICLTEAVRSRDEG